MARGENDSPELVESLAVLRRVRIDSASGDVRGTVAYLVGLTSTAGIQLAEIGTSPKELASCVRRGLLSDAIRYLMEARSALSKSANDMTAVHVAAAMDLATSASELTTNSGRTNIDAAQTLIQIFGQADEMVQGVACPPTDTSGSNETGNGGGSSGSGGDDVDAAFAPTAETHAVEPEDVNVGSNPNRTTSDLSDDEKRALDTRSSDAVRVRDPFCNTENVIRAGFVWGLHVRIGDPFPDEAPPADDDASFLEVPEEDIIEVRRTVPPPLPARNSLFKATGPIQLQA